MHILPLHASKDRVLDLVDGSLAFWRARDSLDQTLRESGEHSSYDSSGIHMVIRLPASRTRICSEHAHPCGSGSIPIHTAQHMNAGFARVVGEKRTWLLYSRQFQCFSNSDKQFSRSLAILSAAQTKFRTCPGQSYRKDFTTVGRRTSLAHSALPAGPPSDSVRGHGSPTCKA